MSDQLCQRNSVKRRLEEIDSTLENLTRSIQEINDVGFIAKLERKITSIRLKREKTQALAAVARSQNLLAQMEILIAQHDLNSEIEKLKCIKKIKLDGISANFNDDSNTPLNTPAHKSCQTKIVSSKVKPKNPDDNKKKTSNNRQKSTKDNKEHNPSPVPKSVPNTTELKKKNLDNRSPPNLNSLFQVKNKSSVNSKTSKSIKKDVNIFRIPIIGQNTTNRSETHPENVSRNSLSTVRQPKYQNKKETSSSSNGAPYKIIYADEMVTSGGDLFNESPEPNTSEYPHGEMVNDLFKELMVSKESTLVKMDLNTSYSSVTTVKLEELLSSCS